MDEVDALDPKAFDSRGLYQGPGLATGRQSFLVFAQQATFDEVRWDTQAKRFFKTQVGYTYPKSTVAASAQPALADAALVVIAPALSPPATRWVFGRRKTEEDDALVERAESQGGRPGMWELARRCDGLFLVVAESETDIAALTLASILASIYLGPIVPPSRMQAYGVQTARGELEKMSMPYR